MTCESSNPSGIGSDRQKVTYNSTRCKEDHDFIFSLFLIFQTCWYIGKVMNGGVGGNCVDGGEVF